VSLRGGGMFCQESGDIEERSSSVVSILIRRLERAIWEELGFGGWIRY
jgi:hypothetical protein